MTYLAVLSYLIKVRHHKTVILCQTPDTLSGVCETLKLYKPYGVTFSKIGFWDGHKHQSDAIQKFHYETDFLVMITHVLAHDGINQGMSKGNNLWIADTVIFFEGTWDVGMGCSFQGREGRQAKP